MVLLALAVLGIVTFFGLVVDRSATAHLSLRDRLRLVFGNLASDTGAWSASGGMRQFFTDFFGNTNAFWTPALPNLDLETHKVALFGNSVTPVFDATAAASQYGAGGTWTTANESTGTGYTAGGTLLLSTTVTNVSNGITMWDAADTAWTTITVTAYGCLIYADALTAPVVDQGIMAVYFGGAFQTTAGNFTIQWSVNGIYQDDNA